MRRTTLAAWCLSAFTALVAIATVATPAFAQVTESPGTCNTLVVDDTAGHQLGSLKKVMKEVDYLEFKQGVDVRVRAFQTAPGGSLDGYLATETGACASWRGPDGQLKSNLVVILMSMDHQDTIASGGKLGLSPVSDQIRADMGDRFRAHDFSGGIALALREISRQIAHPQSAPAGNSGSEGSGSGVSGHALEMFGIVFGCLVGFVLFLWLSIWFVRRRVRAHNKAVRAAEARATAQQSASAATGAFKDALAALEAADTEDLRGQVELLLTPGYLDPAHHAHVAEAWATARRLVDGVFGEYGTMQGNVQWDADKPHSEDEYNSIASKYGELLNQTPEARKALEAVQALANELDAAISDAPNALSTLATELASARQAHATLTGEGYRQLVSAEGGRFDAEAQFTAADQALAQARTLLSEDLDVEQRRPGQAIGFLATVREALAAVVASIAATRQRRAELSRRLAVLQARAAQVRTDVESAVALLATMSAAYAASSLEDIASASDLNTAIRNAERAMAGVTDDLSMANQRWDQAAAALDRADQRLDACTQQVEAVTTRDQELERLAGSTRRRHERLVTGITELQSRIRSRQGHQQPFTERAETLQSEAGKIGRALARPRPDYRAIADRLHTAEVALDAIERDSQRAVPRRPATTTHYTAPRYRTGGTGVDDLALGIALGETMGRRDEPSWQSDPPPVIDTGSWGSGPDVSSGNW